jgi:hypothetical protein
MPFRVTSVFLLNEKVAEAARANQYVLILWMGPHCPVCTQDAVPAFARAEASGNYRNIMFLELEWKMFFGISGFGPICMFNTISDFAHCVLCTGERVTGVPEFHMYRTSTRHLDVRCHQPHMLQQDRRQFPQTTLKKMCCFDFLDGWDETKFSSMLSRTSQPPNPVSIGITLCDGPAGLTIETVAAHGPAGLSGQVFPGDFVISFGGSPCNGPAMKKWRFMQLMNEACSAGSEVELVLMRGDTPPLNVRLTPVRHDSFDKTPWCLQRELHESTVLSQREARFRVGITFVDKDGRAGPVVGSVEPRGPASGQLFPDDLILSWNDIPCKGLTSNDLRAKIVTQGGTATPPIVKIELQREGVLGSIVVTLEALQPKYASLGFTMLEKSKIDSRPGISICDVDPRGPASGQVFPDDLILSWNDIPCKGLTLAELEQLRSKSEGFIFAPDDVKLELQRDGARHPVIVSLTPAFYARPVVCRVPGMTHYSTWFTW